MYLNINGTRVSLKGIIAYAPIIKEYTDRQEFGILVTYESTEVEIALPKDDMIPWLRKIDEELSK